MKHRKILLFFIDTLMFGAVYVAMICVSRILGLGEPDRNFFYVSNAVTILACVMLFRIIGKVYANVWRYADSPVYLNMMLMDAAGGLAGIAISYFTPISYIGIWPSVALVAMFDIATVGSRCVWQIIYRNSNRKSAGENKIGVAIVGAGQIGALLAEELSYSSSSHYKPICFIDTDESKIGSNVCGLKVYADNEKVIETIKGLPVQEIFIALTDIDGDRAKRMYDFYSRTGCKVKLYDFPLKDSMDGLDEGGKRVIREMKIEDLLFREGLKINDSETKAYYGGKTVLVTGGGGSIGSELCRQIAKRHPKKLIIFDIYENNAYAIQQELIRKYGDGLDLSVEIGSVRDRDRLDAVFAYYRPDVVFHAAAHKHVPLMEHSNCEAIKNNVMGTYNTADMAEKYGVSKFVLISTDKAVNPTNIMGASKRMCEMVVQCRADSKTSFTAVRFGNVLGSNGSVIPLFKSQIEQGGPLTITDKRIIRYFMTISEAAQLVIQAGAMAENGDLFVLDMGKPVKIIDLAENMIKLSGLTPYKDIDIVEVGLRPGEKLYEELLIKTENLDKTDNDMIFVEKDTPYGRDEVDSKIGVLMRAVEEEKTKIESSRIVEAMKSVVPTFKDPEEVNRLAAEAEEMKAVNKSLEENTDEIAVGAL